jgi:hypothetical protein
MAEAALLALDLLLVAYGCWLVIRASRKPGAPEANLGLFSYKQDERE